MAIQMRYKLFRVFWIVVALYIVFHMFAVLAVSLTPNETIKVGSIYSKGYLVKQLCSIVFMTCFFYVSTNYFFHLISTKKSFIHYLRVALIGFVFCLAFHLLIFYGFERKAEKNPPIGLLLFGFTFASLFYIALSLLIAYLTGLRDDQKQRKVLEAQKLQLEIEKSQANFNFLKAQINPHFLHNTLNFLYAKSLPYSNELSEGILTLSDIMRYALSEGNASDGKTLLKDEIEHVRNVIKINQLRFSNKLNVQFNVSGVVNGWTIIPFVLITLVENAFKHGDLKNTENPIIVNLDVTHDRISFFCQNRKKSGPKELSTGIGLDNIKKRLELAYGNNYQMNVSDKDEFYTTELIIFKQ